MHLGTLRCKESKIILLYKRGKSLASHQINSTILGNNNHITEKLYLLMNVIIYRATFGKRCKDQDVFIQLIREAIGWARVFDCLELPITSNNVKAVIMDMFSAETKTSFTTIE
ncbi:hypothetical protein RJ639_040000 [Escallonia herrerae]|uniref:Uncharacterized protein n=1 Tax=Escallonia herrerae TaxID=1293975 RepID=A0AA88WQ24_9ASTE|nr:hypothetical protein RJ639_040000 [Escallonia herrerae]